MSKNLLERKGFWVEDVKIVVDNGNTVWNDFTIEIKEQDKVVLIDNKSSQVFKEFNVDEGQDYINSLNQAVYENTKFFRQLTLDLINKHGKGVVSYKEMSILVTIDDNGVHLWTEAANQTVMTCEGAKALTVDLLENVYNKLATQKCMGDFNSDFVNDKINEIINLYDGIADEKTYKGETIKFINRENILWKKDERWKLINLDSCLVNDYLDSYPSYLEFFKPVNALTYERRMNNRLYLDEYDPE